MAKKTVKFYVHQLVIEKEAIFNCDTFSYIKDSETETLDIKKTNNDEIEILSVKKVEKKVFDNRFIGLSFDMGNKYPYPTKVVNEELREEDNPRAPGLIELDEQLFVLIDVNTQRIWISNQQKKGEIKVWLKNKLNKDIIIKSIINDVDFIEKIKSVREISFSVVPNLFNSSQQDTLSSHLIEDMLGFGAKKAKLSLEYDNSKITDIIKSKINAIIGRKDEFNDITVVGRSDENLESTFNLEEITSRVQVDVSINESSKLLDPSNIFLTLIGKIK